MRRSTAILSAAAAAGGAVASRRAYTAKIRSWDTNHDPTDGQPTSLPPAQEISVRSSDGATLHGHRCGSPDGPTVVMVHGLIESTPFWAPVARSLSEMAFDVVLVDQRGHGRSERGSAPYATATLGDDLRIWIEHLELDDLVLVGHSMGGVASMALASDHADFARDRLKQLLLVATLASPTTRIRGDVERLLDFADRAMRTKHLGLFALLGTFGTHPARPALEATRHGFLNTDRRARADAVRMLGDFDLRPELARIEVPTQILAGSHDDLTPLEANEEIAELIPGARLEVVHGKGHMLFFEAPDRVSDAVIQAHKPTDID